MPDPAPLRHDRIRRIHDHVQDLCADLAGTEPTEPTEPAHPPSPAELAERLRALSALRTTCDRLLGRALVEAMTDARKQGWALRRIADAADYSHEHVRHLIAHELGAPDGIIGKRDGSRP